MTFLCLFLIQDVRGVFLCLNLHIVEEERSRIAQEGSEFGMKIFAGLQLVSRGMHVLVMAC